jgi:membrane-associated phospholipid phosphatase
MMHLSWNGLRTSRLRGKDRGLTLLASLPFLVHAAWAGAHRSLRPENALEVLLALAAVALAPRGKRFFAGVYPLALVGLVYDSMRGLQRLGMQPGDVHLCDLRAHEMAWFGITVDGHRGTLHDWLQVHSSPVLDRLCAVPYCTFIPVCIAFALWVSRRDYPRMLRFVWVFFALNIAGFVTYHLYPAAPPWYFHAHGCVVDLQAHASAGPNLARVDAWLGFHYFAAMYGRAADVFGAMPSLHCAYACLVAVVGWPAFRAPGRVASIAFYALMCFSAVYLDHHWVLDAIAGSLYCVTLVGATSVLARMARATRTARATRDGALVPEVVLAAQSVD